MPTRLSEDVATALQNVPGDGLVIRTDNQALEAATLRAPPRADPRIFAGATVCLYFEDVAFAAQALVSLDGVAGRLVLLSPSAVRAHTLILLRDFQPNFMLSDQGDLQDLIDEAGLTGVIGGRTVAAVGDEVPGGEPDGSNDDGAIDTVWCLTTSGTTGIPKVIEHSLESLTRTTKRADASHRGQVWGLLYDFNRFAGLQVTLQALMSGSPLISPAASRSLGERVQFLADHGCTHLSATPTLWRMIMMRPESANLQLTQVTLGGEIADDRTLSQLRKKFPDARVVHIYASTEAGVGFSVQDGKAGFPESYLSKELSGVSIKVENGHLWLKSAHVSGGEWYNSLDAVEKRGGRFIFLGRDTGALNVGGNKVFVEEIENFLYQDARISAARVYGKQSSIAGTLIMADIVPSDPHCDLVALKRHLTQKCTEALGREKTPAMFKIVETIEVDPTGKVNRST